MTDKDILDQYVDDALMLLKNAHIVFPKKAVMNVYHHMGIRMIRQVGAVFLNIVNRDYCKSYVIMLSGQKYPNHYHRIKMESFYVLYGNMSIQADGNDFYLHAGDMLHINRGQNHSFLSDGDVVFEEISTTYVPNDSIYEEPSIQQAAYEQRKTVIKGRKWKEIWERWNQ